MSKTFVIAEAGVNHNGDLHTALRLVDAAAAAGADAVKFQTFRTDALVTAEARKAKYQQVNTGSADSQAEMLRALELSPGSHDELASRCAAKGIAFMSTAFDSVSLALLAQYDMPAVKIPSGDITAGPLLLEAARLKRKLIMSTGMASLGEVESALSVVAFGMVGSGENPTPAALRAAYLSEEGQAALQRQVTLLHCVTQYPAPPAATNLRAMDTLSTAFGLRVGYSDHTLGIAVPIAAVARGATVIEKHFTLDRGMPGPDHAASLEPLELRQMIDGIRTVEDALGSPLKGPTPDEIANIEVVRRSLVAAVPIKAGQRLTREMLTAKRPATGMSPMQLWKIIGSIATRDYNKDDQLMECGLE